MSRIPTDPEQIRQLAVIMAQAGLTEVEMSDKDTRIRVVRGGETVTAAGQTATGHSAPASAAQTQAPAAAAPAVDTSASHAGAVTSPMVGVAYLAPEPGAANFVTVGQQVTAGQTLLLIEAMKTFNDIVAPQGGVVKQILVEDGQPVEYGQVLMVIE